MTEDEPRETAIEDPASLSRALPLPGLSPRALASPAGALAACAALGAALGLAARGAPAGGAALGLVLPALALAVVVPWRAAAADGGAARRLGGALLHGLALALPASAAAPGAFQPLALLYLLVAAAGLAAWTVALGRRAGQLAATSAGLLLLGAPYLAGPLLAPLPPPTALRALLLTPLPVLAGTFAETDVLRSGTLYRELPLAQSMPYTYAAPADALAAAGVAAGLGLALAGALRLAAAGARRRAAGPASRAVGPVVAAAALAAALAAPSPASAQSFLFPAGDEAPPDEVPIGELSTRVNLGYFVPLLDGRVQLDGKDGVSGSRLTFDRVLELDPLFVMPTFEVMLAWENGGRIWVQYLEGVWDGEAQIRVPLRFEERRIDGGSLIDTRYRFRSVALGAAFDIPLLDFLTLRVMTTQRYVKHEVKVRATPQGFSGRNSLEAILPTIGVGVDAFVWNVVSAYADVQWLDFRTSMFGGKEDRWELSYREAHVGVRLELVEHAHVMVEWFALDTQVRDGGRETYRQTLNGPRVMVAVLF